MSFVLSLAPSPALAQQLESLKEHGESSGKPHLSSVTLSPADLLGKASASLTSLERAKCQEIFTENKDKKEEMSRHLKHLFLQCLPLQDLKQGTWYFCRLYVNITQYLFSEFYWQSLFPCSTFLTNGKKQMWVGWLN